MSGTVFLVDDDPVFRESLEQSFELAALDVQVYAQPHSVLANINDDTLGVIVSDVRMPKLTGEQLLTRVAEIDAAMPVILLTGHGDVPMAVRSLQAGAFAFYEKPVDATALIKDCQRAMALREAEVARRRLARQLQGRDRLFTQVLGSSPKVQALRRHLSALGATDTDVLISGETGAGKEVAARALHSISARSMQPFVPVNCASLDGADINEQLFGIEDQSGLGASLVGVFERADKGTLFLDEIESMPLDTQGRLLRILEERRFRRVGGQSYVAVNLRVMAAAKTDLHAARESGTVRPDLYYRLSASQVTVPPVRERGADRVVLFEHFLSEADDAPGLSPEDMTRILRYDWPGNVREIRNAAGQFALGLPVLEGQGAGQASGQASGRVSGRASGQDLVEQVADFERSVLEKELHLAQGDLKQVMERLGLPRKTLADKLARYNLRQR